MSGRDEAPQVSQLSGVGDLGVPFDVFIQALTLQLDKAQAAMALKARVGKLPLTFAVKDVQLDLRAFVRMVEDDVWVRPAGPGEAEASSIKLALTTVTKPMIDENAVSYEAHDAKLDLKEALGERISTEEQRQLERIGVHTIQQLQELKKSAGADVVARLARMPVNRLQQAMMAATAPRVQRVDSAPAVGDEGGSRSRVTLSTPSLKSGRLPQVRVNGQRLPVRQAEAMALELSVDPEHMGQEAEIDFGDGETARLRLSAGAMGSWHEAEATAKEQP
ncbi:hypothetical protein [Pelomonas sp. BJYL3]|uniref:hypothetical protein n=1 Tax=Pelomonas sp. BJYL3 TaxID=2976697 RepID=UPI0022B2E53F|nr:hypothetical protein [Pelomonas sp. BJYL3]